MSKRGYNSVVECHFDVVKVIGSNLIIPKFINLYPFFPRYRKRLVGLTLWGRWGYTKDEFEANIK